VRPGFSIPPPQPAPTASAVLIQPNLDVAGENRWSRPGEWEQHIAEFKRLAGVQCKTYIAGIPQTGASTGEIICPPYPTHPDLVVWPESPAPFIEGDPVFSRHCASIAHATCRLRSSWATSAWISPRRISSWRDVQLRAGHLAQTARAWAATTKSTSSPSASTFPSRTAALLCPQAHRPGLQLYARRPSARSSFLPSSNGGDRHRYGVFICYESVFADEVRQFAQLGAEVLVNISDDGWYGDTSAPWQHLNMARMRAIENRRWILRDTNNGVTAVIDPYGRVRQSIPRHADGRPARRLRLPQRCHLLHRSRRHLWMALCTAEFYRDCLVGKKAAALEGGHVEQWF
jgi:apolipoprotein N-acyltransferase